MIELRNTVHIRTVNNNRVGIRDVDTVFNDSSSNQYVKTAHVEATENIFKLSSAHLSVCYVDQYFRNKLLDFVPCFFQTFHTVMQVEHLPAAVNLKADSLRNLFRIKRRNNGFYGTAVLRRGG